MSEFKITEVSLGIDHTLFLTSNGQVLTCGVNNYHQLGLKDVEAIQTPTMLNSAKSKLPMAKGIAASKFHSLYWTSDSLYTWGLNGGQLGHMKNEKTVAFPKLVSSLKGHDISQISSSDGAVVILTKNGDLFILYDYQTKRIAHKQTDVVRIQAIGGHLDPKALASKDTFALVEKGGLDLKIFVLNAIGRISVWQEKSGSLIQCLFSVSRELWIKDIAVFRNGLFMISREGTAYNGIHQPKVSINSTSAMTSPKETAQTSSSLFRFVDKDQCDLIRIKRVPYVHRGAKVSVDPKGNNFCVLQTQPNSELNDFPWIQPRTLSKDLLELYSDSALKDLTIKVHQKTFSVHKYILVASSSKLAKLILEDHAPDESIIDLSELTEVPELFEQVLKYAYYQDCDMMREGQLPFRFPVSRPSPEKSKNNEFSMKDLSESAHQVYSKQKKNSSKAATSTTFENGTNFVVQLQDLAKRLGFHDMVKNLDHFTHNLGSNSIKKKVKASILCPIIKTWSRYSATNLISIFFFKFQVNNFCSCF